MKKQSSLRAKLITMGAAVSVIALIMGVSNLLGLRNVSKSYKHVTDVNLINTQLLGTMMSEYRSVRIEVRTLSIEGLSPTDAKAAIAAALNSIRLYEEAEKKYHDTPFAPGEEDLYNQAHLSWLEFKKLGGKILANYESGTIEGRKKNLEIFTGECPKLAKVYVGQIQALFDFQKKQSDAWIAQAEADAQFAQLLGNGLILGLILFTSIFALILASRLNRAFGTMVEKLSQEANELAQAAERITETSGELSGASTEQASAIQETASAIAQVSAMVSKNAENAEKSLEVTRESSEQTKRGKESVQSMIASIHSIDQANGQIMQQIEHSNRQMGEFVTLIHEIGEKTKVINDIVFQTKLLSFNASVEAARAGEHGKGFAVVAEEVGNLAQMSGNAAREISGMLQSSSQRVETIARETREKVEGLMAEASTKVQNGMSVSNECSEVFEMIVSSVEQVSNRVKEIAMGSKEQSQGVSEIMKAIHQMDQVTQQNSASSRSVASEAVQLSTESEKMRGIVKELTVVVRGGFATESHAVQRLGFHSDDSGSDSMKHAA